MTFTSVTNSLPNIGSSKRAFLAYHAHSYYAHVTTSITRQKFFGATARECWATAPTPTTLNTRHPETCVCLGTRKVNETKRCQLDALAFTLRLRNRKVSSSGKQIVFSAGTRRGTSSDLIISRKTKIPRVPRRHYASRDIRLPSQFSWCRGDARNVLLEGAPSVKILYAVQTSKTKRGVCFPSFILRYIILM